MMDGFRKAETVDWPPKKRQCVEESWPRDRRTWEISGSAEMEVVSTSIASARLDMLPAEILVAILDHSREASLIHTCRSLRYKLPAYIPYTKTLAIQALMPLKQTAGHPGSYALTHGDLSEEETQLLGAPQDRIRAAVFSSSWFGERQLDIIHRELFKRAILKACSKQYRLNVSPWQLRKVHRFLKKQPAFEQSVELNLRFSNDTGRKVYLRAKPFAVTIENRYPMRDLHFDVLDWGERVPSKLLCFPMTEFKASMLRKICGPYWLRDSQIPHGSQVIDCDLELLSQAILDIIAFDEFHVLSTLLQIEKRSRICPSSTILEELHLRGAVRAGNTLSLTSLLDHIWQCDKGEAASELELMSLMNEAKTNLYPNWFQTTRFIAMEIATRWKITEVQNASGTAVRHHGKWPPSVSITTTGSIFPRIWYIPGGPAASTKGDSAIPNPNQPWLQSSPT